MNLRKKDASVSVWSNNVKNLRYPTNLRYLTKMKKNPCIMLKHLYIALETPPKGPRGDETPWSEGVYTHNPMTLTYMTKLT